MSVKSFALCMLVGLAASLANAQTVQLGKCDESITAITDFDAASYTGLWYENQRSLAVFQSFGKCVSATYTANADGTIGVLNKQINTLTNSESSIAGTATYTDVPTNATLSVNFPGVPVNGSYWVLGTDYKTYSAVYSCTNMPGFRSINMWMLTRDRNPSAEVVSEALAVFEKAGLDASLLKQTDQTDCTDA